MNAGPLLPEAILNGLIRDSGAHVYTPPGDLVYANDGFLGIYTGAAGRRVVQFKQPVRVFDLFAQHWITDEAVDSFMLDSVPETMSLWKLVR